MISAHFHKVPDHPRLIFMGTPDFAVPTLRVLIEARHHILGVVTQPDRPRGRGKQISPSPVKEMAFEHGLTVFQPEKAWHPAFCGQIRSLQPDLIIVIAFGQILKKEILDIPKWGVVNIHASLLPKYRGAAPIQWAVLNDETRTGLTLMQVDEGLDTGPILDQEEVPILADETAGHLHDRLARKAADRMVQWLEKIAGHPIQSTPQNHTEATYAPKIERALAGLDWRRSARDVSARIRGLDPKPGAYTLFQGREIKFFASRIFSADKPDVEPGRVASRTADGLLVEASRGVVEIREVQYPGKKRMPAGEFLKGFPIPAGTMLGQ